MAVTCSANTAFSSYIEVISSFKTHKANHSANYLYIQKTLTNTAELDQL